MKKIFGFQWRDFKKLKIIKKGLSRKTSFIKIRSYVHLQHHFHKENRI